MAPVLQHRLGRLALQTWQLEDLLRVPPGEFRHVVTVNAEIFVLAHEVAAYGELLSRTINVIDGRVVQQLVRIRHLRWRLPRTAAGSDAIYPIAAHCSSTGHRMFLLGASGEVNSRACEKLRAQYPGLRIEGFGPPMVGAGSEDSWSDEALSRIRGFEPFFLGVCLGSPREGFWIDRHRSSLSSAGVRIAVGLGGTADFVAGEKPRAPRVLNWLGLEWLYRVLWEPRRRWKRTLSMFRMPYYALLSPRH
jgi:N-acetylglucosaminyldiphosphoundecaprenol N-acetyl-beta-D-mannosaminyltransferase